MDIELFYLELAPREQALLLHALRKYENALYDDLAQSDEYPDPEGVAYACRVQIDVQRPFDSVYEINASYLPMCKSAIRFLQSSLDASVPRDVNRKAICETLLARLG